VPGVPDVPGSDGGRLARATFGTASALFGGASPPIRPPPPAKLASVSGDGSASVIVARAHTIESAIG
jgi:hypothetical protein